MRKAMPERPPLLTKPRNAHSPKLFTLTAMRKAMAESQVLLTIDAGSCHGISKLENVPRVSRVSHVPPANGKAGSTHHKAHSPKQKPYANGSQCAKKSLKVYHCSPSRAERGSKAR